MNRRLIPLLLGVGCLLIAIFLLTNGHILAQDPQDAELIGSRECNACHRDMADSFANAAHKLTFVDAVKEPEAVVADFASGDDVRLVQFPEEDAPRAFTLEDVAYVIGAGRNVQRYAFEVGSDDYRVLPAEWNVATSAWQPFTLAESWEDPSYNWGQSCAGCHTTGYSEPTEWEEDSVQCEACHGAGSTHADAADDAGNEIDAEEYVLIRSAISTSPDAETCGQCHSRGVNADGLPFAVNYSVFTGNLLDSLSLPAVDDKVHWWTSGHASQANMQYNEWALSGHASALSDLQGSDASNPECLTCHSADYQHTEKLIEAIQAGTREGDEPESLTIETAQFGVTCVSCHSLHGETEFDALLVDEPNALCASCHQQTEAVEGIHHPVKEMVEGLALVEGIEPKLSSHFTDENGPDCVTCHMLEVPIAEGTTRPTHTFSAILPGSESGIDSCTSCHTDISADYLTNFISGTQEKTQDRVASARTHLEAMPDAPAWVTDALAMVEGDGSWGVHNTPYTETLLDAVEVELGLVQMNVSATTMSVAQDPTACSECHADEYRQWHASPHANASLIDSFLQAFADQNQPDYCMGCHASGYNPDTSDYVFEGVVCTSCHTTSLVDGEHPPGPIDRGESSELCGQCHSGAHAPTYNEWLMSDHKDAGVDCVDCHTPHNNGLILEDINATCGDCHQDAMVDDVHMGSDMTCVDCHMATTALDDGTGLVSTGHSMEIQPKVCSDCHGDIHRLSAEGGTLSEVDSEKVAELQREIGNLEEKAENDRNSGAIGGAIGAVLLIITLLIIFRFRKLI